MERKADPEIASKLSHFSAEKIKAIRTLTNYYKEEQDILAHFMRKYDITCKDLEFSHPNKAELDCSIISPNKRELLRKKLVRQLGEMDLDPNLPPTPNGVSRRDELIRALNKHEYEAPYELEEQVILCIQKLGKELTSSKACYTKYLATLYKIDHGYITSPYPIAKT